MQAARPLSPVRCAILEAVERSLLKLEAVFGALLDAEQDAVQVYRLKRHSPENQEVERALQEILLFPIPR